MYEKSWLVSPTHADYELPGCRTQLRVPLRGTIANPSSLTATEDDKQATKSPSRQNADNLSPRHRVKKMG